jgi:hypothetical protein
VEEETVPIWRRVPVWLWGAIGGAILLAAVIAGATWLGSPGPESLAVVSPTSTPVPATATPIPTADVAATETALAERVAGVVAASLAQTATAMPTSTPTPTDTPTQTPVPPTATAPHTLTSPTPTPISAAIPQPASSISSTVYLRDTRTEAGFAALSADQPYGWKIYEEGRFVYGEAAVPISDTVYHFDEESELGQLPDPWRVEFEFAEALVARTIGESGFDRKKARFWVGTLGDASAVGEDNPYSLTMNLYEGDQLRESVQVWFTVADAADFDEGMVFSAEEVGLGGGGGGGGSPIVPPGQGGEPPGQAKDKKEPPGKSKDKDKDK